MNQQASSHPLTEQIGPCYDIESASKYLGITPDEAVHRAEIGVLLSAVASDGVRIFPTFQFRDGHEQPVFSLLAHAFTRLGIEMWAALTWMTTPSPELDDRTPTDVLNEIFADITARTSNHHAAPGEKETLDLVFTLADETAQRWTAP